MGITINNSDIVSGSWGSVDKTALKNKLKDDGSGSAVREAYLFVGDMEKTSTWKFPHHTVSGDSLKVHQGGVHSAAQRLVSTGATSSNIPKKAAARHLLKHYSAMKEDPPESLSSMKDYLCYEEAAMEVNMLITMNACTVDNFVKPKSKSEWAAVKFVESELIGVHEEIPEIIKEMDSLPILGVQIKGITLDEILEELDKIMEEDGEQDYEDPEAQGSPHPVMDNYWDTQPRSAVEGGHQETGIADKAFEDLKVRVKTKTPEGVELESMTSATIHKGMNFGRQDKRTIDDYRPDPDELKAINQISGVLHKPTDVYSFTLESADDEVDRQGEAFDTFARDKAAAMSYNKAFLIDHSWDTAHHLGTIYAAKNEGGKLLQKVFVLDIPENQFYIKNMAGGVFNKVSVGFSANLNDMHCMSCSNGISIYDSMCPHMPGQYDEKGVKTYVLIKDISDYYETSLVPIPAQRNAGVQRSRSVPKNADTINTVTPGDDTVTKPTTVDSKVDEKSVDLAKAEDTSVQKADMPPKKDDDDEDDEKALTTGEVAGQRQDQDGNGMECNPYAKPEGTPPKPKKSARKLAKIAKSLKKTVSELKQVAALLKSTAVGVSAGSDTQKALENKVEALTKFVEVATATTVETIERGVAAKKQAETAVKPGENQWAADLTKGLMGGQ